MLASPVLLRLAAEATGQAPDDGGEEAGAAEAAAEAEAAEGHEEDRDRRDAGEGVHADVAVQLVGLLHLLLVDDDDGGDGEEVDAHEDEPDELEGVEEAGEAEDAAVLGVRQREHAQAVHDHRRAVHCDQHGYLRLDGAVVPVEGADDGRGDEVGEDDQVAPFQSLVAPLYGLLVLVNGRIPHGGSCPDGRMLAFPEIVC